MLHGVLNMPPELWHDGATDVVQRYGRYMEASRRIEDLTKLNERLTNGLNNIAAYAVHPQAKEMARQALDLDKPLREMVPITYEAKDG
jgi:hypothetical protein